MSYEPSDFNDRHFTTDNTGLPDGEYRYHHNSIHQDAASGQAQQAAASGNPPPDANKKSSGPRRGTALLLAGCLVLSLIGGAGGAVLADKLGLTGSSSTVLYQAVETPAPDASTIGYSYSDIVQRAEDSVVAITTESIATSYFFRQYVTQGAGSGVVLSTDGYIVTNYHVISGARQIAVTLNDGTEYAATLVGSDAANDIAVLKVDARDLPAAEFGDSEDLEVGDTVYAIGNPLGYELWGTMTDGIVSAVDRNVTVDGRTMTLIQTNAALNSGNSGGPLINEYGQVVGLNVIKMSSSYFSIEGLGFAIPSATMDRVVDDLLDVGEVLPQPLLGLSVRLEATQLADGARGLEVVEVTSGGASDRAGIRVGDYVTSAEGYPLETSGDLLWVRRHKRLGDQMTMTLWRNGETVEVTLSLRESLEETE